MFCVAYIGLLIVLFVPGGLGTTMSVCLCLFVAFVESSLLIFWLRNVHKFLKEK